MVFVAGFVLFSASKLALVIVPYFSRQLPVETDDAFAYIVKAAQIEQGCFFQDCESLRDLREQLDWTDPDASALSWFRYRLHWTLINVYSPSHSLILAGLHLLGMTWVNAYWVLSVVGSIAMSTAIAWWLSALWGLGGAGIALTALSLVIFPSHGLHYIVPTNLALCVGFFLWTFILKCKEPRPLVLGVSMTFMIGLHPVGRLFAMIGMAISLLRPLPHAAVVLCTGAIVVVISYIVPHVIDRPDMLLEHNPMPEGMSFLDGVVKTAQGAASRMGMTGKLYLAPLALAPLAMLFLPRQKIRPVALCMLSVSGAFFVSFFYVLPHGWGEVPVRLSVPVGILAVGGMGYLSWLTLIDLYRRAFARSRVKPIKLIATGSAVATIFYAIAFGIQWSHYQFKIQMKVDRQNYEFDTHQTEKLLQRIGPHEKVLYAGYVPVLLYLANGLYPYGAVLYGAIRGTPDEAVWLRDSRLRYVVARSPIVTRPGVYDLKTDDSTILYVGFDEPLNADNLVMELESQEGPVTVEVAVTYAGLEGDIPRNTDRIEYDIARRTRQTVKLTTPSARDRFSSIQLSLTNGEGPVILGSIRRGTEAPLQWIWDEGMYVRYNSSDSRETVVRFDSSELVSESLPPLKVIADKGFCVLAERIR